jgi:hypothetical protein
MLAIKTFESVAKFKYFGTELAIKIAFLKELRADMREYPLPFGPESFVFHFAIQKYKD